MIIDHPGQDQMPGLRQLWKDTFSDTDAFLDAFFAAAFSPGRCLCAAEGAEVLAAVYWFDCSARDEKIAYLYALAVQSAHRGNGIGSRLMEKVHALLAEQGYQGVLLVPQEAHLQRLYSRRGYRLATTLREFTCSPGPVAAQHRQVDAAAFARLRREYLPDRSVIQEGENLAFLETQVEFYAGDDFLLTARKEADRLFAPELLGNLNAAPGILRTLGCSQGTFRTIGCETPFAMYRPLNAANAELPAYFAFAFD